MSKKQTIPSIGSKVKIVNCAEAKIYEEKVWTVISEPLEVCDITVVKLKGKCGGFDVSCLQVVEKAQEG